jgi:hypothetical protein
MMGAMTAVLAHPFRLAGSNVATVDDDSEAGARQEIAVLVTTQLGERLMVPDYGVTDPTFGSGLDLAEVNAGLSEFGPDGVVVTGYSAGLPDDRGVAAVTLEFDFTTT